MKIVVADTGKYIETLRKFAGSSVVVLPPGYDWTFVTSSDDAFEALLQRPAKPLPIDPQGSH